MNAQSFSCAKLQNFVAAWQFVSSKTEYGFPLLTDNAKNQRTLYDARIWKLEIISTNFSQR